MTWRSFRLTQSFWSDRLSLNTLQSFLSFFFFQILRPKNLSSVGKLKLLYSPLWYIIQLFKICTTKQQRLLLIMHTAGGNPALCTSVTGLAALTVVTTPESVRSAEVPEGHEGSMSIEQKRPFYSHFSDQNCTSNQTFNFFLYTPPASIKQWVLRATGRWPELGGSDQSWTALASGGMQNPSYQASVPLDYQSQPKGILTNEINTVLPVTAFQMLLPFKKFVNE